MRSRKTALAISTDSHLAADEDRPERADRALQLALIDRGRRGDGRRHWGMNTNRRQQDGEAEAELRGGRPWTGIRSIAATAIAHRSAASP
jgi:hypothetical protein